MITITINEILLWLLATLAVAGWAGTWFFAKAVYRAKPHGESEWDGLFGSVLFIALFIAMGTVAVGFFHGVT